MALGQAPGKQVCRRQAGFSPQNIGFSIQIEWWLLVVEHIKLEQLFYFRSCVNFVSVLWHYASKVFFVFLCPGLKPKVGGPQRCPGLVRQAHTSFHTDNYIINGHQRFPCSSPVNSKTTMNMKTQTCRLHLPSCHEHDWQRNCQAEKRPNRSNELEQCIRIGFGYTGTISLCTLPSSRFLLSTNCESTVSNGTLPVDG